MGLKTDNTSIKPILVRFLFSGLVILLSGFGQEKSVTLPFYFIMAISLAGLVWRVLSHASSLSVFLGDPYGTVILTLASVAVEFSMVSALLFNNVTPDTHIAIGYSSFALVALACNLFGAICLVLNGSKKLHRRTGINYYLAFSTALIFWVFILPCWLNSISAKQQVLLSVAIVFCFIVFLVKQNFTQVKYFQPYMTEQKTDISLKSSKFSLLTCIVAMVDLLFVIWSLIHLNVHAEELSVFCRECLNNKLSSFIVAFIVLAPEGIFAILSTKRGNLMRGINIFFGSIVASLSITGASLLLSNALIHKHPVKLGVGPQEICFMVLTLLLYQSAFTKKRNTSFHGLLNLASLFIYLILSTISI